MKARIGLPMAHAASSAWGRDATPAAQERSVRMGMLDVSADPVHGQPDTALARVAAQAGLWIKQSHNIRQLACAPRAPGHFTTRRDDALMTSTG